MKEEFLYHACEILVTQKNKSLEEREELIVRLKAYLKFSNDLTRPDFSRDRVHLMFMHAKVWLWNQQLDLAQEKPTKRSDLVSEILQDVLDIKSKVRLNQKKLFTEGVYIAYYAVSKLDPNANSAYF